jgi:hypothetical protein
MAMTQPQPEHNKTLDSLRDRFWESGLWEEFTHDQLIMLDKVVLAWAREQMLDILKGGQPDYTRLDVHNEAMMDGYTQAIEEVMEQVNSRFGGKNE